MLWVSPAGLRTEGRGWGQRTKLSPPHPAQTFQLRAAQHARNSRAGWAWSPRNHAHVARNHAHKGRSPAPIAGPIRAARCFQMGGGERRGGCAAMRGARVKSAQRRPLQELRLQQGAERTNITPLLRRLRLKDHDGNTPVPRTQCPPGRIAPGLPYTAVPCSPCRIDFSPQKIPLEPLGNATPDPVSISEPSGHATLVTDAPEPPNDATSGPDTLVPSDDAPQEASPPETPSRAPQEPHGSAPVPFPFSPSLLPPLPPSPDHPSSTSLELRTPDPAGSTSVGPCTLDTPGSPSPGPPGTSTPQHTPFRRWRAPPPDLSCSPVASQPLAENGDVGTPPHHSTLGMAGSPSPAPPEQCSPQIEAVGSEPVDSAAAATPVSLSEPSLGAVSWIMPLVWLERTLPASSLLESLRHSLPLSVSWRDAGTNVTPVPTAAVSTGVTPVPTVSMGTTVTPVSTVPVGSSVTPVPTMAAGTTVTPVPTGSTGTNVTPVSTGSIATNVTPVSTGSIATNVTPVSTGSIGTSVTPVPTGSIGTSVTPVPTMAVGTSVTPVLTVSMGTTMTPEERSAGTSIPGGAKDSAAETDSLLWHCPREQLRLLPRAELEGRLESTLIIIEALSLQLRDWQDCQRPLPAVGPAGQRDAHTQTDVTRPQGEEGIYHDLYLELRRKAQAVQRQRGAEQELARQLVRAAQAMDAWTGQRRALWDVADTALQGMKKDHAALEQERLQVRAMVSRCEAVLQAVPGKLQSCLQERDAAQQHADEALRAKQESDAFLEAFRSHAAAQIGARTQSLELQQELSALLAAAVQQQVSLAAEAQPFREFIDVTFANLQEERGALDGEVSQQLEETLQALQDAVTQGEQLAVTNSRLSTDLSTVMKQLASLQQEQDALQQDYKEQKEMMSRLTKERDALQRERQELQEAAECREFLDQENRMSRRQLMEVEAKLQSTLTELQECSLQHEELLEAHQGLQEERAALQKELESTKAELQDLQLKRDRVSWCSAGIAESKARLQKLADCLRAALPQQDDDDDEVPSRSKTWTPGWRTPRGPWTPHSSAWTPVCRTPARHTPHRARGSFVGSVLKAVSGRDGDEGTGCESLSARDRAVSTPKPPEPEDGLMEQAAELRAVVSDLSVLSSRIQELEQSEFRALQAEICDLQLQLEKVTTESQERMDAQAASIAKLNKALQGKLQNEKELQDVVKQQEAKMLQLIDKSEEVTRLQEEVTQLKRSLQRAETEAKVLWEEMRGQEAKGVSAHVQERVLLRQEVDKLRLLLLEKEDENVVVSGNYLEQVRGLELRLSHAQKMLRNHEELWETVKEVLLSLPEVPPELGALLQLLGLKPNSEKAPALL
ncbi:sperm-associated antigen 5 isoform X3 [Lagopus muta]|uniref:sperm-associated antigen 5 isoform X3 n=1 Tax=Lagopus muta TaxID=64668 RepID=UPI0020A0925A|nr:sperm-associated antigen 5 isoform X3 [Lagopus muta]